jgi:hypothetical protein
MPSLTTRHLLRAPRRVTRPINGPLNMSCDAVLTRIKLTSNNAVLAKRATYFLADLANGAVRVD